ncbi:phosphotransferase [Micromonospora sp. C51]|uniref:phosphotransferase enzyme family protein n=1 Tax=Micromonospora sp. C51 TaxID=2824879 RepID=UPI001B38CCBD|nr:phosphotransferase [Micromonospora sp. C51]MBQ1048188.1 phosphotransferase [Micromonospora sp. C51]
MDAAELADRFGLGRARELSDGPVARGRQGEVWRLETVDGRWAVKVPFHESGEDRVRASTRFQEAACAAGVPVPAVRRATDGRVLARVGGRQVRVYEWIDLDAPDPGVDPVLVGAAVAAIHRVVVPAGGQLDPWYIAPVGAPAWDRLIERLRQAGAPFAGRLAALRDELVALESWLEQPATLRTCHRDLWADNILRTAQGGVCVIDWENSGPADPGQELACVLFEFGRSDPGRARALMSAYVAGSGPATVARPGDFSMLIAQLGHIAEIAATDWLEPNVRNPDRAGAAAWISEVLDEPHTREVLCALLHAVSGTTPPGQPGP